MKRTSFLMGVVTGLTVSALGACAVPALSGGEAWGEEGFDEGAESWIRDGDANAQPTAEELTANPNPGGGGVTPPAAGPAASAPPLLSWDGGVVDGPTGGSVVETNGGGRDLAPSPTGRMRIIELYQAVLDERDALADEAIKLSAALEKTHEMLDRSEANGLSLANRVATMQAEIARLENEGTELAARLTTAQIRRLEAEKMLLEARIEWHRQQDAATAAAKGAADDRVAKGNRP